MEIDKHIKNVMFSQLEQQIKSVLFWTKIIIWFQTVGKLIVNVVGAMVGTAWMLLILAWVWTGDLMYLKIFAGILSTMLVLVFQWHCIVSFVNYKRRKYWSSLDMTHLDTPLKSDINNVYFDGINPTKYKVIDQKDELKNKQLFLYPMYGRLNSNGTISFYKENQLAEIHTNKNT